MPLPIISNTLRLTVRGTLSGGQLWTNTWHAQKIPASAWTSTDIASFHLIFKQIYVGPAVGGGTPHIPAMVSPAQITDVVYTILDGSTASSVLSTILVGSTGGDSMPPQTAMVVTIRTAFRGRANRGRVYLPATAESDNTTNGVISSTQVTNRVNQIIGVQAALVAAGYTLGVGSYGPYKPPSTEVPHFHPATSFTMDGKWDTQRRRVI